MTFTHKLRDVGPPLVRKDTPNGRYYENSSGVAYPSITTMLSAFPAPELDAWRDRIGHDEADKITRQAAWRGTRVHNALETYVNNIEPTIISPIVKLLFTQHRYLLEDHVDEIYGIETPLYSDYLRLAGTADLIARFKRKRSIIDFKNSLKPKKREWVDGYFTQTCAYSIMWEERTGEPIQQMVLFIANEAVPTQPQIFVADRDEYAPRLLELRKQFDELQSQS